MRLRSIVLLAIAVFAVGCGGSSQGDHGTADTASAPKTAPTQSDAATASTPSDIGVGPVKHVDVASLDMSAIPQGTEIFNTKCSACHKLGERYIGPALEGVTKRRKPEWILNMMLNPDTMVKEDPTAKQLLAEYLAPMTNMNLTEDQAKSVLAFFLEHDKSIEGDDDGTHERQGED